MAADRSPAPEQQAQPSFTGDSSIKILSDDIVIVAEKGIRKEMKHLGLTGAKESAGATTSKRTIFQVPKHICAGREALFRPQIVSIGPYARDNDGGHVDKELLGMEVVKMRFLSDLMTKTSESFLAACLAMLRERESAIRSCYYKSFDGMRSEVFIKMMLLDGIFIIQYFMKCKNGDDIYSKLGNAQWNVSMIMHDLLLLENQIPFFVLQDLFDRFVTCNSSDDAGGNKNLQLLDEIHGGFTRQGEFSEQPTPKPNGEIRHLLHLYHRWYTNAKNKPDLGNCMKILKNLKSFASCMLHFPTLLDHLIMTSCTRRTQSTAPASILSATKLHEAGVKFKKKKEPKSILDVTFNKINGHLEIPHFVIDDMTTYKFANLISLEQSADSNDVPSVITSYAAFMDKVIDTSGDVEILRHKGILDNMMASNEDVANFFNELCRYSHLDVNKHYLVQVFKDVDAYSRSCLHNQRAWFVRNYFSNVWVLMGLVVAAIVLTLTILQTYVSVYTFYHPPSAS